MARPIPAVTRRTLGGEALKLLPDDVMRELSARAVAILTISTTLDDGDGLEHDEGDEKYSAIVWLAEGLVDQLNALAVRRDEPAAPSAEAGQ